MTEQERALVKAEALEEAADGILSGASSAWGGSAAWLGLTSDGLLLADALGHLFPDLSFRERRRFAWGALSAVSLFIFALQVAR